MKENNFWMVPDMDNYNNYTWKPACSHIDGLGDDLLEHINESHIESGFDVIDLFDADERYEKRGWKLLKKFGQANTEKAGEAEAVQLACIYCKSDRVKSYEDYIDKELDVNPAQFEYNHDAYEVGEVLPYRTVKLPSTSPELRCPTCKGTGKIKCKACKGTGMEKYTADIYANGKKRIKQRRCSECGGSGRIECPDCLGVGHYDQDKWRVESLSRKYSFRFSQYGSLNGEGFGEIYDADMEEEDENDDIYTRIDKGRNKEKSIAYPNIIFRKKDEKTVELDNTEDFLSKISDKRLRESLASSIKYAKDDPNLIAIKASDIFKIPACKVTITEEATDCNLSYMVYPISPTEWYAQHKRGDIPYASFFKYIKAILTQ